MSLQGNLLGGLKTTGLKKANDLISGARNQTPNANKQRTGGMQRFISQIQAGHGLYRGVFFEVIITNLRDRAASEAFSLLCHQSALPGFRLETKDNVIYALPYETPVGVVFDPCWCTFYIDNTFALPSAIYDATFSKTANVGRINPVNWSPKYRDPATLLEVQINAFMPDPTAYATLATNPNLPPELGNAAMTTSDGLPLIAQYTLKNAFIKTVQQTPVDWSAHNALSSMTLEFSYEWLEASYPGTDVTLQSNKIDPAGAPVNFDTIINKYPALGVAYDAAKRTVLQNPAIMNNPILNQGSQYLP